MQQFCIWKEQSTGFGTVVFGSDTQVQGLKLKFLHDEESKEVFTKLTTSNSHVGNGNTVHNGLVCAVIDEGITLLLLS